MSERTPLEKVFHFDAEGTLPPPGPLGRLLRLSVGVIVLNFTYEWLFFIDSSDYLNPFILLWVAFSIYLVPYVINIGFGINSGGNSRYFLVLIWALAGISGFIVEGSLRSEQLWLVVEITQIYVYGHLGVSFLLSALLSTPGCEMRAIPQLLGKVSGKGSQEHYCPGFLDSVDRWELKRKSGAQEDG